jgi:hypothetical protein
VPCAKGRPKCRTVTMRAIWRTNAISCSTEHDHALPIELKRGGSFVNWPAARRWGTLKEGTLSAVARGQGWRTHEPRGQRAQPDRPDGGLLWPPGCRYQQRRDRRPARSGDALTAGSYTATLDVLGTLLSVRHELRDVQAQGSGSSWSASWPRECSTPTVAPVGTRPPKQQSGAPG